MPGMFCPQTIAWMVLFFYKSCLKNQYLSEVLKQCSSLSNFLLIPCIVFLTFWHFPPFSLSLLAQFTRIWAYENIDLFCPAYSVQNIAWNRVAPQYINQYIQLRKLDPQWSKCSAKHGHKRREYFICPPGGSNLVGEIITYKSHNYATWGTIHQVNKTSILGTHKKISQQIRGW